MEGGVDGEVYVRKGVKFWFDWGPASGSVRLPHSAAVAVPLRSEVAPQLHHSTAARSPSAPVWFAAVKRRRVSCILVEFQCCLFFLSP